MCFYVDGHISYIMLALNTAQTQRGKLAFFRGSLNLSGYIIWCSCWHLYGQKERWNSDSFSFKYIKSI